MEVRLEVHQLGLQVVHFSCDLVVRANVNPNLRDKLDLDPDCVHFSISEWVLNMDIHETCERS